jgi:hypothetical protein
MMAQTGAPSGRGSTLGDTWQCTNDRKCDEAEPERKWNIDFRRQG